MARVLTTPVPPGQAGAQASWGDAETSFGALTAWPGQPEYENFILTGNPSDGQTYTLQVGSDTQVYTFRTVASVAGDVLIGASAADTQENLAQEIGEVQGDLGRNVVYAANYADPVILVATDNTSQITQTDGTGGNIDRRPSTGAGTPAEAAQNVVPFHIRKAIAFSDVTDGRILLGLPLGYTVFLKSGLILDGSKGGESGSMQPKDFDGQFAFAFPLPGVPDVIEVSQGTVNQYVQNDVVLIWGFLEYNP